MRKKRSRTMEHYPCDDYELRLSKTMTPPMHEHTWYGSTLSYDPYAMPPPYLRPPSSGEPHVAYRHPYTSSYPMGHLSQHYLPSLNHGRPVYDTDVGGYQSYGGEQYCFHVYPSPSRPSPPHRHYYSPYQYRHHQGHYHETNMNWDSRGERYEASNSDLSGVKHRDYIVYADRSPSPMSDITISPTSSFEEEGDDEFYGCNMPSSSPAGGENNYNRNKRPYVATNYEVSEAEVDNPRKQPRIERDQYHDSSFHFGSGGVVLRTVSPDKFKPI